MLRWAQLIAHFTQNSNCTSIPGPKVRRRMCHRPSHENAKTSQTPTTCGIHSERDKEPFRPFEPTHKTVH